MRDAAGELAERFELLAVTQALLGGDPRGQVRQSDDASRAWLRIDPHADGAAATDLVDDLVSHAVAHDLPKGIDVALGIVRSVDGNFGQSDEYAHEIGARLEHRLGHFQQPRGLRVGRQHPEVGIERDQAFGHIVERAFEQDRLRRQLGLAAQEIGDIGNRDDHAARRGRLDVDIERPAVAGQARQPIGFARFHACDLPFGELVRVRFAKCAEGRVVPDRVAYVAADSHRAAEPRHEHHELFVVGLHPQLGVDHADTLRHVIKGRIHDPGLLGEFLALQAAQFEQIACTGKEFFVIDRVIENIGRAGFQRTIDVLAVAMRRHDHDRQDSAVSVFPDMSYHHVGVHLRHAKIGDDEVRRKVSNSFERGNGTVESRHRTAVRKALRQFREHGSGDTTVIDYGYIRHASLSADLELLSQDRCLFKWQLKTGFLILQLSKTLNFILVFTLFY